MGILIILDYVSTYAFLELSGNKYLFEGGSLARWALREGGFSKLFWTDMASVSTLVLLAIIARLLYSKRGFQGFGRAAFVLALVPYVVITMATIYNNIVLTFL